MRSRNPTAPTPGRRGPPVPGDPAADAFYEGLADPQRDPAPARVPRDGRLSDSLVRLSFLNCDANAGCTRIRTSVAFCYAGIAGVVL